jgi:hypothetical protein
MVIECPDIDDEDGTETTSTSPLTEPSSGAEGEVGGVASRAGVDNEDNAPAAGSGISSITGVASSFSFSSSFIERKTRKSSKQKRRPILWQRKSQLSTTIDSRRPSKKALLQLQQSDARKRNPVSLFQVLQQG